MEVNITSVVKHLKSYKVLLLEPERFSESYLKASLANIIKLSLVFILIRVVGLSFNQTYYNTLAPEWLDNALLSTVLDTLIFFVIFVFVTLIISGIYYFVLLIAKKKLQYKQWLSEYTILSMFTFIFTRLAVLSVAVFDLLFTDNKLARNTGTGLVVDFVSIAFAAWMGIYLSKLVAKQTKISEAWTMMLTITYLLIHLIIFGP